MPNGPIHPHLARLERSNLDVRYRASHEPQDVVLRVHGSPKYTWQPDYHFRLSSCLAMIETGLASGSSFAPEEGEAECLRGDVRGSNPVDEGPELEWLLRVRGVAPQFLVLLLNEMADGWAVLTNYSMGHRFETEPQFYPRAVSVVGALPVDASDASANTDRVLAWLTTPEVALQAWPDVPFRVREKRGRKRGARVTVRMEANDAGVEYAMGRTMMPLSHALHAHPDAIFDVPHGEVSSTKRGLSVSWERFLVPADVARGPLLNLLRRFHVRVAPIAEVELDLP